MQRKAQAQKMTLSIFPASDFPETLTRIEAKGEEKRTRDDVIDQLRKDVHRGLITVNKGESIQEEYAAAMTAAPQAADAKYGNTAESLRKAFETFFTELLKKKGFTAEHIEKIFKRYSQSLGIVGITLLNAAATDKNYYIINPQNTSYDLSFKGTDVNCTAIFRELPVTINKVDPETQRNADKRLGFIAGFVSVVSQLGSDKAELLGIETNSRLCDQLLEHVKHQQKISAAEAFFMQSKYELDFVRQFDCTDLTNGGNHGFLNNSFDIKSSKEPAEQPNNLFRELNNDIVVIQDAKDKFASLDDLKSHLKKLLTHVGITEEKQQNEELTHLMLHFDQAVYAWIDLLLTHGVKDTKKLFKHNTKAYFYIGSNFFEVLLVAENVELVNPELPNQVIGKLSGRITALSELNHNGLQLKWIGSNNRLAQDIAAGKIIQSLDELVSERYKKSVLFTEDFKKRIQQIPAMQSTSQSRREKWIRYIFGATFGLMVGLVFGLPLVSALETWIPLVVLAAAGFLGGSAGGAYYASQPRMVPNTRRVTEAAEEEAGVGSVMAPPRVAGATHAAIGVELAARPATSARGAVPLTPVTVTLRSTTHSARPLAEEHASLLPTARATASTATESAATPRP